MKKYKLGIIGLGGMGTFHYDFLKNYDRIIVSGIYDINPERQEYARNHGIKVFSSKEELFDDEETELILVATSNEVHKELCIEAMSKGKHVICEKPVTMTSQELIEVIEASDKYKRVFTIDQNRRTNKDFVLMKRTIEKGLIGKPYVIESRVEGSRGMPTGWRTIKKLGGGMMLDWGVHLIDQILYMTDKKVTSVYCKMMNIQYSDVEDNFRLAINFEDGLLAHIEVSTNNYITHPRWYALGDMGTAQIDDWDCVGKVVRSLKKEDSWDEEIVFTKAGPTKTMAPRNENSTETILLSEPHDVINDLSVVYNQFIDAIDGIAPLTITPNQAMRVLKVMEASFESAKTGEAIKVFI